MKCVKKTVRHYWKYSYEDATTPSFNSQAEASAGIDGYKMLTAANLWALTQNSTIVIDPYILFTFDIGENTGGIKELSFCGIGAWSAYVSLKIINVQCSEDNITWATVASAVGDINYEGLNTLTIPSPNNYRYIRFTTYNDDTGWAGGGYSLKFVYGKRIVIKATQDDYDYFTDDEVAVLPKEIVRHYWKYIYEPWTQPKATANTTAITGGNMVTSASSNYSGEDPWRGFNGTYSGTSWASNSTSVPGWWQVKFPYFINVKGLTFYQRNSASGYRTNTARFYTGSDRATPIGNEFNPPATDYGTSIITGIPEEGIYTDTIYLYVTAGYKNYGMGMLDIEGYTRSTIEGTPEDYDYYTDDPVFYGINQ